MLGNVSEWCRDPFGGYDVSPARADGERRPDRSSGRVYRGGSWTGDAAAARASNREWAGPGVRDSARGLRPSLRVRSE